LTHHPLGKTKKLKEDGKVSLNIPIQDNFSDSLAYIKMLGKKHYLCGLFEEDDDDADAPKASPKKKATSLSTRMKRSLKGMGKGLGEDIKGKLGLGLEFELAEPTTAPLAASTVVVAAA